MVTFLRRYLAVAILTVIAAILFAFDFISRVNQVSTWGLPPWLYELAAFFFLLAAVCVLVYQLHNRMEALEKAVARNVHCSFDSTDPLCVVMGEQRTWYRIKVTSTNDKDIQGSYGKLLSIRKNGWTIFKRQSSEPTALLPYSPGHEDVAIRRTIFADGRIIYLDVVNVENGILNVCQHRKSPLFAFDFKPMLAGKGRYEFEVEVVVPTIPTPPVLVKLRRR